MSRKRKINFWSKRIQNEKTARQIANELNVDEEKIRELTTGQREIKGQTMDRVLKVIEEDKINRPMKDIEILQWYRDTDLKKLREEFGYEHQSDVARLIGCHTSVVCNFENKKAPLKVTKRLIDLYTFYNNDFNRNNKLVSIDRQREKVNKSNKHIWKWYKSTDIRTLRKSMGLTGYELAQKIYVAQSCVSDLELKRFKNVNKTMINAYNFFINNQVEKPINDDVVMDWYKSVEDWGEYRRAFGYSLNKFMSQLSLSYDQARTFERGDYRSASDVVRRAYEFYHNEDNRLDAIIWQPNNNNVFTTYKKVDTTPVVENKKDELIQDNEMVELKYELKYAQKLNEVYEKIIDKLLTR